MADFVDNAVKDIDGRLEELKLEVQRLEAARAALLGDRRGPRRSRASATGSGAGGSNATAPRRATTRRAGRPRGRRGGNTRANQALQLVKDKPGITIPEIASALKIEPNYLYRVMPKLVEDGSVKREGQGWHPAQKAAA